VARLVVDTHPVELGLHNEQWENLEADLRDAGHEVEFAEKIERRSAEAGLDAGTLGTIAIYVYIVAREVLPQVRDRLLKEATDELAGVVRRRLRGRSGKVTRTVSIVNGLNQSEVLTTVEVPVEE
jgi:hypothetical protein